MNSVSLSGRLVKDAELRTTPTGKNVARFTIAVQRRSNREVTDFINCVAWNGTADLIGKWFKKGSPIEIVGEINTRNWDGTDGHKHYATEINVSNVGFPPSSKNDGKAANTSGQTVNEEDLFEAEMEEVSDEGLPF